MLQHPKYEGGGDLTVEDDNEDVMTLVDNFWILELNNIISIYIGNNPVLKWNILITVHHIIFE